MKTTVRYAMPLLMATITCSCTQVIDLPVVFDGPRIVIQGNVYDMPGPYTVYVSQTVPLDSAVRTQPVAGASVQISDNAGHTDVLTETAPGTYTTSTMQGQAGLSYTLTVTAGGQTYASTSTMPPAVDIDSLWFSGGWFDNEIFVTAAFRDPPGTGNCYRLMEYINKELQDEFNVANDRLSDGGTIRYSIWNNRDRMKPGRVITVWLETIDKAVYKYFSTSGRDNLQSAAPANPVSNISNGALGYFSAASVRTKAIMVGE
jgi:hypothetical protein